MRKEKIAKSIFCLLLIIYLVIYFASSTGYYEYRNYRKMTLTEDKIEEFENDVKNGKEVDLENYIVKDEEYHNNKLANFGKRLSYTISDTLSGVLSKSFEFISKFVTN